MESQSHKCKVNLTTSCKQWSTNVLIFGRCSDRRSPLDSVRASGSVSVELLTTGARSDGGQKRAFAFQLFSALNMQLECKTSRMFRNFDQTDKFTVFVVPSFPLLGMTNFLLLCDLRHSKEASLSFSMIRYSNSLGAAQSLSFDSRNLLGNLGAFCEA